MVCDFGFKILLRRNSSLFIKLCPDQQYARRNETSFVDSLIAAARKILVS